MSAEHPHLEEQFEQRRSQGLKFTEVWKIIRYRKVMVGLIFALAVLGTFLGHFIYTPTYTAQTSLSVKTETSKSIAEYLGAGISPWGRDDIGERIHNYVQYIKSNNFLLKVSQDLKFKTLENNLVFERAENLSFVSWDFWLWVYQSMTGQMIAQKKKGRSPMDMSIEEIAGFLSSSLNVTTNHTDSIFISVKTLDDFTSMTIANSITKEFARVTNEHDARGLIEIQNMLKEKMDNTKMQLKSAELSLIDFKKQNRVSISASQSNFYSTRINEVEKQIEGIKLKLDENKKLISYYSRSIETKLKNAVEKTTSPADSRTQLLLLTQRLDQLKQQRSLMYSQNYNPDHWRIKEVNSEIGKLAREIKSLMSSVPSAGEVAADNEAILQAKVEKLKLENRNIKSKLPSLEKTREELLSELTKIPQAEQNQLMLQRKVELEYENFSTLQKKLHDVEIQLVSIDKKVFIERLSNLPGPSKRRSLLLKLLFSTFVGLFFGCVIALLLEYMDTSIRHKSDLEELGLHFLGEIPCLYKGKRPKYIPKGPAQLVTLNQPDSLDSVVFDFVRSRLESSRTRAGKVNNSITITSVRPGEGKSFVAANLAVSLSQLGKKTLLIDCDLRCPSVHTYFDLPNDQGLVDLFESDSALDEVLHKDVTANLNILTASWGCKNPTVLVSSEKFRIFMKYLRNEYDYVVVDTPPVGAVADSSIVANMTDSIALVSKYRFTTKHDIEDAQFKIHQMSSKRIHGIINFVSDRDDQMSYYPYLVPKTTGRKVEKVVQGDDLQRFEEQLKKRRIG